MSSHSGKLNRSQVIDKNIRRKLPARSVLFILRLEILGLLFFVSYIIWAGIAHARPVADQDEVSLRALEEARQAYNASRYEHVIAVLKDVPASHSHREKVVLWRMKSYYEMRQMDAAIATGEKAIGAHPNSAEIHMWLGRAYGRKAEKAGIFSGMSLAKKARREFETAVRLDATNLEAQQDLVEYYCSAPAIMGGGEEKARKQIAAIAALDAAEGHFARAECWSDEKDWPRADAEFQVALRADQKRAFVVFEIADYFTMRRQPDRIVESAEAGAKLAPGDSRAEFYRGVALVLKNESLAEAELHLKAYLEKAPKRMAFPSYAATHEWLGRLYEQQGRIAAAATEYGAALQADPQNKAVREAVKRLAH
jgi:tetratricopeptide (TPR) repeat protein